MKGLHNQRECKGQRGRERRETDGETERQRKRERERERARQTDKQSVSLPASALLGGAKPGHAQKT